jgi:hypothetical protein
VISFMFTNGYRLFIQTDCILHQTPQKKSSLQSTNLGAPCCLSQLMSKFLVIIWGLCALEVLAATGGSLKMMRRHGEKRSSIIGQDASFKMDDSEQELKQRDTEDEPALDFNAVPELLQGDMAEIQDPDIPDIDDVPEFSQPEEDDDSPAADDIVQQTPNVKQPVCTIRLGDQAGSSDKGLPNSRCLACSQSCTAAKKQKAIYIPVDFSPSLTSFNAFSVQKNIFYRNVTRLALWGRNAIYDAAPIGFSGTRLGGYFGAVMKAVGGRKLELKLIFSIWDKNVKSVPASQPFGCRRNCNDCGGISAGRTTGTQCSVSLGSAASVGENVTLRLYKRTAAATATWNNKSYPGSEWEIAYLRGGQTSWTVFGRMLLESTTGGINRLNNFHEHVGCTPCDAFYENTVISIPEVLAPQNKHVLKGVYSKAPAQASCKLYRTVAIPNPSGPVPLISIETGPGVTRSTDQQYASLFTC